VETGFAIQMAEAFPIPTRSTLMLIMFTKTQRNGTPRELFAFF